MKDSAQKYLNTSIANNKNSIIINIDELVLILLLLERLTEIISGIKTVKLVGINPLIIMLTRLQK